MNRSRRIRVYMLGLGFLAAIPLVELVLAHITGESGGHVVINEIFYHSGSDEERLEYVELYNPGVAAVDLSGWAFGDGIEYKFNEGSVIEPNGYLVLCGDMVVFEKEFGFKAYGQFTKTLNKDGERVQLADKRGRRVDSVRYDDSPPWPISADGYSASLERICPNLSGELQAN